MHLILHCDDFPLKVNINKMVFFLIGMYFVFTPQILNDKGI